MLVHNLQVTSHNPRMNWLRGAWAVFLNDVRLELRQRYALNTLALFVAGAMLLAAFAVGRAGPIGPSVRAGLLWIVVLFAASLGLGRVFVGEEERGTGLLLRLNVRPGAVYAGKLLFNTTLTLGLNAAAVLLFVVLLGVTVEVPGLLAAVLALGALGLAGTMTLLGAIIARTARRGPLMPVLAFPLLLPLLSSVVRATREALLGGAGWTAARGELLVLVGFAGAVVTASFLLFDYVWRD